MINKVTLIGHLGKDPEVKHLESGAMVAQFSLATNESYKDKNGEWQTVTEWHNIVVWRELAERAEKFFKKGNLAYIEGKVTYRKYQDKDGIDRYATDIVANVMRSLEKREGSGSSAFSEAARFPTEERKTSGGSNENASAVAATQTGGDDLPF